MREFPDPCGADPLPRIAPEEADGLLSHLLNAQPCSEPERELRRLGYIIDLAGDLGREDALRVALRIGNEILKANALCPRLASLLHYFLSNAWESKRCLARSGSDLYAWEQPELERQAIHLRLSIRIGREASIESDRLCQMLTNLGNLLSHCGRVFEAIASWDAALGINPNFGMALGNRATGLYVCSRLLHDSGHRLCYLREAHKFACAALSAETGKLTRPVKEYCVWLKENIEETLSADVLAARVSNQDFGEQWSAEERSYRKWSLSRRLFLNDLNDLNLGSVAAADVLNLPPLVTPLTAPQPSVFGFFNQLKQEFVSARYFYYSGTRRDEVHFSDRQVKLTNTFDYPAYGLAVEEVKLSFRVAYSLFDKIAFLLNHYLELKIPEKRVSFRSLWYEKGKSDKGLRGDLGDPRNVGMKALFWLSKDLYEARKDFAEAMEPEAQEIANIRHHIEHKYLKLHLEGLPKTSDPSNFGFEALAHSLGRGEFESKTLRLLQLSRSALLYLVHALYAEEYLRRPEGKDVVGPTVLLDDWEDDWKI